jgi:hypothetical protein
MEYTAGFILKKKRFFHLATWRIMQVSINKEKRIFPLATWKIFQVSPHLRKVIFPPCLMEDTAGFTILKNIKKDFSSSLHGEYCRFHQTKENRFFHLVTRRILKGSQSQIKRDFSTPHMENTADLTKPNRRNFSTSLQAGHCC